MADSKAQLELEIIFDESGAIKGLKRIKKETTETGGKGQTAMQKFGAGIDKVKANFVKLAAGIAITAVAIKKVIGIGAAFEEEIAKVASVSGVARKELAGLAREAGKSTVFSARQAASALFELSKAGVKTAESMRDTLEPSLRLATAGELSLADATATVVKTSKIFGISLKESAGTVDILAQAANSSLTTVSEMAEAIKFAGPIAKIAGLDLKKTAGILALLANKGVSASMAGTSLRMAMLKLSNVSGKGEKILKKYGISADEVKASLNDPIKLFKLLRPAMQDVTEASELLGTRSTVLAGVINDTDEEIANMINSMDNAGGAAERLEKERLNTLTGSIKLMKSAFEELIISGTGEGGLMGMFRVIVDATTGVIKAFQKMPAPLKGISLGIIILTPLIYGLIAALGPVGAIMLGVGAAMTLLLPKMVDFSNSSERLAGITEKLKDIQSEYKDIIEKLNDPTEKLTKSEKALLELRKSSLELKEKEAIQELIKLRNDYNENLKNTAGERIKVDGQIEKSNALIIEAAKLQKILNNNTLSVAQREKALGKEINKTATLWERTTRFLDFYQIALQKIKKARKELTNANKDSLNLDTKLNNAQIEGAEFIEVLAQSYINYRDNLDGAKFSQKEFILLNKKDQNLIKKKVILIDKLAKIEKEKSDKAIADAKKLADAKKAADLAEANSFKSKFIALDKSIKESGEKVSSLSDLFKDLGSSIGGAFGKALSTIGEFGQALKSGIAGVVVFVVAQVSKIFTSAKESAKELKKINDDLTLATMAGEQLKLDATLARLEKEKEAVLEKFDLETRLREESLLSDSKYQELLEAQEAERIANMTAEELEFFNAKKSYEEDLATLQSEREIERKKLEDDRQAKIREVEKENFNIGKQIKLTEIEIERNSRLSEVKGFKKARQRESKAINQLYNKLVTNVSSLSFPGFADGGTVGGNGGVDSQLIKATPNETMINPQGSNNLFNNLKRAGLLSSNGSGIVNNSSTNSKSFDQSSSLNIHGDIIVQANNAQEFGDSLKELQLNTGSRIVRR